MILPLLLSAFAAGLIATTIMVFFLYLPRLWDAPAFEATAVLGAALTGRDGPRAKFMGTTAYFLIGILFALFYGWIVLLMLESPGMLPSWQILPGAPVDIDLIYPVLGAFVGLLHGILLAILLAVVVVEHHPVEKYRAQARRIPTQAWAHVAYGATVMFFHHQLLQLLLAPRGP